MSFTDKVAVVTGGAKGIGGACSALFLREGARVALLDVDDAAGQALAATAPDRACYLRCDVADSASVEAAFAAVAAAWGGADILVNNAGIQRYGTVTQTDEALWDEVMNVNLKSAFLCSRAALPQMQARGGGVVVMVASVQAFHSQQNVAAYTTSKTALLGLTRSIAVDYAPAIRCVAVCPGTVDTPMMQWAAQQSPDPDAIYAEVRAMHPVQRIADPSEVAELVGYLASDKAAFITGQPFRIDGGLGLVIAGSKRD